MDVLFTRIAVEELSFFGKTGCSPNELFDKLSLRISDELHENYLSLLNNTRVRKKIIENVIKHPETVIIDTKHGVKCSIEVALFKSPEYQDITLISNDSLRRHVLDLNIYSNISEVEGRLAVFMTIASKGFEGCWQYEISKILKMDPKTVFQHLKSLYKYDVIVRFSIPMPTNHKKRLFSNEESTSVSGGHVSAIIWLSRFFEFNRIPRELSQLIWYQHIQPLSTEIVRILEYKAPGKIAWEKDIRALCAGFLILHDENSAEHLICSQRTANKVFNKVRDALLINNVRRVFAWDPSTKSYAPCLCLKDAFPSSTIEISKDQTIKTEINISNLSEFSNLIESKNNNFSLDKDVDPVESLFSDFNEEHNNYSARERVFEITETDQVLWLIRASGNIGIVSLDIVKLLGINMKRLGKLLTDLCKLNYINKIPQRYNRTFMYRYYYIERNNSGNQQNISDTIIENGKGLKEQKEIITESNGASTKNMFYETFPKKEIDLSSLTEQFIRRLVMVKKWIEEFGSLTIPELGKLFSDFENTPKGPDRKTIRRILSKLLEIDDSIKETFINSEKGSRTQFSSAGDVAVFFSSNIYSEEQARSLKATELKNKRSNTTKSAIERRKKELSHVAAIVDASIAIVPKSSKENSSNIISKDSDNDARIENEIENEILTPKLISSEKGEATVVINTPNFTVASLNIEIDKETTNTKDFPNLGESLEIAKLNVPGTLSSIHFSQKLDPCKRMNLGFSNILKRNIKVNSNKESTRFLSFSQKILAHYGFVFPLMIRLKLLHQHILSLAIESNLENNQLLSNKQILDEMNIDNFLRIIGFGYRSSFIEEYLISGSEDSSKICSSTRMKDLPSKIYETLTGNHSKKISCKPIYYKCINESKGRKATIVLFRLLSLLSKLNILSFVMKKRNKRNYIKDDMAPNSKYLNIDPVSISNPSWKLHFNIEVPLLISSSEIPQEEIIISVKHRKKIYDLRKQEEFENFWAKLQNEAMETQKFILKFKYKNYSILLPDILLKRHWKDNPLLSLEKRNSLEKYARELMFGENYKESSKNDIENSGGSPIVLSLASPEIRAISNELSITPLVALRYLLRVVDSISLEDRTLKNGEKLKKRISFHPIRDPRYQCHICYALYSTHPAIISHYKVVHDISAVSNSIYTIKKSQSLNDRGKNLNLNSVLKTQIISENYIPSSLKHLIGDENKTEEKEEIKRDERIILLRAFLRLTKEDIILLYLILFINEKTIFLNKGNEEDIYENIMRIFLLCKEKNIENNLYSLQFSRINSLIREKIGKTKLKFKATIRFLFSCLKTIYPLNSKLIDTINIKERHRICWYYMVESNSLLNKWKNFLIMQNKKNNESNRKVDLNYLNVNFEKIENEFVETSYSHQNHVKYKFNFEDYLIINMFKSELLSSEKIIEEPIFRHKNDYIEGQLEIYVEYCIKNNILKHCNSQNESKSVFSEDLVFTSKFIFSRHMLLNCFGKTLFWREIFDLCFADLKIFSSNLQDIVMRPSNLTGAFALTHLNNLVDDKCTFEIEWSDKDFYEKATNKTDEDLYRLLNEALEANFDDEEVDVLNELNYEYPEKESNFYELENSSENLKFKKSKTEKFTCNSIISQEKNGDFGEEKTNPVISKIIARYECNKNCLSLDSPKIMEDFSGFNVSFLGTNDSDPIEFNNIPFDFSIKGIILNYSQNEIKGLKRKISLDPIFIIIKRLIEIVKSSDIPRQNAVLNTISSIIVFMNNDNKIGFSIEEIEDFVLNECQSNIPILKDIEDEIKDPAIIIYNFKLPIVYHLIFMLEFLRICIRVPINGKWIYVLHRFSEKSFFTVNLRNNAIFLNQKNNLEIPINIPARIWLLWSIESISQLLSENEIKYIHNIINNFLIKIKKYKESDFMLRDIDYKKIPLNGFVCIDGQINKSICGLLIYYICYSIQKSPIINLSEFISRFPFFNYCEIKFMIESLFGEGCIYKDEMNIIFSKSIPSILHVFEI